MCGLQQFPSADVMDRLGNHIQLSPWYVPCGGLQGRGGAGVWHVLTPAVPAACGTPAACLQLREPLGAVPGGLTEEWYPPMEMGAWTGTQVQDTPRLFPLVCPWSHCQVRPCIHTRKRSKSGLKYGPMNNTDAPVILGNFLPSPPSGSYFWLPSRWLQRCWFFCTRRTEAAAIAVPNNYLFRYIKSNQNYKTVLSFCISLCCIYHMLPHFQQIR